MARSREEQELIAHFADQYMRAQSPAVLELERTICGCDYGATSWTTRGEAEHMGRLLELDESKKLLEIGAGSGWPALYLAGQTGCNATLADLPIEALRIGADRVTKDPLDGAITLTVADGAALPFKAELFDAICHSDVLCCLAPKRRVLHECMRVIRRRGRMVFSVISIAPGLSGPDHARAVDSGPPFVDAEYGYGELLERSGWLEIDRIDVSAAYEKTGRQYLHEIEVRAGEMCALLGEAGFSELLEKRQKNIKAVAEGIVRRDIFVAIPSLARA
jgi:ubiquinone/menaquinone biosynthesis C-methylase UbiE